MEYPLHGKNIIGYTFSAKGMQNIPAFNPVKGFSLGPSFFQATELEIDQACLLAQRAASLYEAIPYF